jgi:hypothetical protein
VPGRNTPPGTGPACRAGRREATPASEAEFSPEPSPRSAVVLAGGCAAVGPAQPPRTQADAPAGLPAALGGSACAPPVHAPAEATGRRVSQRTDDAFATVIVRGVARELTPPLSRSHGKTLHTMVADSASGAASRRAAAAARAVVATEGSRHRGGASRRSATCRRRRPEDLPLPDGPNTAVNRRDDGPSAVHGRRTSRRRVVRSGPVPGEAARRPHPRRAARPPLLRPPLAHRASHSASSPPHAHT